MKDCSPCTPYSLTQCHVCLIDQVKASEKREKVLEEALERARYDLDGIGDYGRPLLSIERIDEAIARVKAMREGKHG